MAEPIWQHSWQIPITGFKLGKDRDHPAVNPVANQVEVAVKKVTVAAVIQNQQDRLDFILMLVESMLRYGKKQRKYWNHYDVITVEAGVHTVKQKKPDINLILYQFKYIPEVSPENPLHFYGGYQHPNTSAEIYQCYRW